MFRIARIFVLALISFAQMAAAKPKPKPADVTVSHPTVTVGGRSYNCAVVRINLKGGRIAPRLMTAQNGIGRVDSFENMIRHSHAVAAINGSYFDAYTKPGEEKEVELVTFAGNRVAMGLNSLVNGDTSTETNKAEAMSTLALNNFKHKPA